MSTKEKLLTLFENNRELYFSGEELAQKFSISRAAIWKAVKNLQNEGYAITAVPSKGYALAHNTDILSEQGITKYLADEVLPMTFTVLPSTTSTNTILREEANKGAPEGTMVLANEQTAGRGRLGRTFDSPKGTGIYMSLLLRPRNYASEEAVKITTMAAVAMCEAIEAISDEVPGIKWVNDIFVRGKKVCGILTEGSFHFENGLLNYAILGIGINIYEPDNGFPEELQSIAGAVLRTHQDDVKNKLVAEFVNHFFTYYASPTSSDYVEEYRKRCFVIGKEVQFIAGGISKNAKVIGIDDACRILLQYPDGHQEYYASGEISIRI